MKTPQSDAALKIAKERIDQTASAMYTLEKLPSMETGYIYVAPNRIQIHVGNAEMFFEADFKMRSAGWTITKEVRTTYEDVIVAYMLHSTPVEVEILLPSALYWGIIERNREHNELFQRSRLEDQS